MILFGPKTRHYLGIFLHAAATAGYILAGALAFMFVLELLKAREILYFQSDLHFAFRGAVEVALLAILFAAAGWFTNRVSRRLAPHIHGQVWRRRV